MLSKTQRSALLAFILPLFLIVAFLQIKIDPMRHKYEPSDVQTGDAVKGLPIEFALGAFTGFREAVAGLLWVRTDEFFHTGDYEAITPMIRIITWLDPHFIDVYETGAWHMDYNFTDTDQRSDRRYIPLALALMREGIKNNPDLPELYSDLAFTHYYRKITDFNKSREYYEAGQKKILEIQDAYKKDPGNADKKAAAQAAALDVTTLGHGLAHTYEALGMTDQALAQWQYCLDAHNANMAAGFGGQFGEASSAQNVAKQIKELTLRRKWRATMLQPPVDMHFDAQLVRVAPKVFEMRGKLDAIGAKSFVLETGAHEWGPIDGTRIEIRLQDDGYQTPVINNFSLNSLQLDPNLTIMQDSASVRNGAFKRKIDMSKDPEMYSFTAPKYTVTMWFNPSSHADTPPNVQDRIGWRGEGMTDSRYLDTSGIVPGDTSGPQPGLRLLKKTFTLTRDDVLGQGQKVFE
ncbi:hypothetical protein CCAX7_38730 [Capsulimonas corticalis]|uniref:Uncharacterized protein n=1 Tax=Capsulimonas corticalis TaxID=2219043 RepID=A0A402D3N4_9BACT|nr:hypothetical protein [Capsulimonas corticalis]BDI31822.1 hypothetical protein CCAX7_38730 [Capsulimonas corticalis]